MAKAKKKPGFTFKGFVNLEFSQDDRDEIIRWVDDFGEEPAHAMVVLVEAGYKVSVGYDDYHACYQVSMTCKDEASSYCGHCFTLKHADIGRGMLILRYVYDSKLRDEILALDQPLSTHDW